MLRNPEFLAPWAASNHAPWAASSHFFFLMVLVCCLSGFVGPLPGQEPPEESAGAPKGFSWKMETLYLRDGKQLQGVMVRPSSLTKTAPQEIEFLEIVRPQGAPMYLIGHFYARDQVARAERLSAAERRQLLLRIGPLYQLKKRARVEAGRMENISLDEKVIGGIRYHVFRGDWFNLWSTTDAHLARRCAVRLEQMFTAYRRLLPPRRKSHTSLRIIVYGAMEEYHDHLRREGLSLTNPAYYSLQKNLIVAGGDLSGYARRLGEVRAHNEQVRRQYEDLLQQSPGRLARLREKMQGAGFSPQEIRKEVRLQSASWKAEYNAALQKIKQARLRNDHQFAEVAKRMFQRLYHESFHAYMENYLFPHRHYRPPSWLNEGLAQVFEDGQLDADTLRLDAPGSDKLKRLQEDLTSRSPLPLDSVLTAPPGAFLAAHSGPKLDGQVGRRYLYSWGLAYYLMFQHNLFGVSAGGPGGQANLEKYVTIDNPQDQPAQKRLDPIERFENLVQMPLDKFEEHWRQAMLRQSATSAPRASAHE